MNLPKNKTMIKNLLKSLGFAFIPAFVFMTLYLYINGQSLANSILMTINGIIKMLFFYVIPILIGYVIVVWFISKLIYYIFPKSREINKNITPEESERRGKMLFKQTDKFSKVFLKIFKWLVIIILLLMIFSVVFMFIKR